MNKVKLDAEEAELLASYESGEWQPIDQLEAETQRYREYARATFRKDSRVNIRISAKDLEAIQKKKCYQEFWKEQFALWTKSAVAPH